jgi:hypothetical protein
MRFVLSCLLGVWLICSTSAARDIYVNNLAGDDRFDGTQERGTDRYNGPVRTIAKAMRLAQPSDVVRIANTGVPYHELISVSGGDHSGTPREPFRIEGSGAVLDGSVLIPPLAWDHYRGDVFRFRPRLMGYQQLFLEGRPLVRRAVPAGASRPATFNPREWYFHGGYIYFRIERDRLIDDYRLWHAGHAVGITLYKVHDVIISDLVVQGFQLDGVNAHEGVRDSALIGLICRGNGRSGITVAGTSRLEIESCISGDNGYAQLYSEGLARVQLIGTQLLADAAPALVRQGGEVQVVEPEVEQ